MEQIKKFHTEFWVFTVFDELIEACPSLKNKFSGDIRIYWRLSDFENDFGDFDEYEDIKKIYKQK